MIRRKWQRRVLRSKTAFLREGGNKFHLYVGIIRNVPAFPIGKEKSL